ncbi:MAG TPA: hypothetical protein PKV14_12340, partial [Accumulibacter sp.]|nr:hypothetical protein [Accumulibacter sp.]
MGARPHQPRHTESLIRDNIPETYCRIDDCYKAFEPQLNARLLPDGKRHRLRKGSLSLPEWMTLVL